MNLMMVPSLNTPSSMRNRPASIVATMRPERPSEGSLTMPKIITMKAPVGPPICTREPPRADTTKPPMMAVRMPCEGDTPEAMPKAMASGRATMPTMRPAMASAANFSRE